MKIANSHREEKKIYLLKKILLSRDEQDKKKFLITKIWIPLKYPFTITWLKELWYIVIDKYKNFIWKRIPAIWDNVDKPGGHYAK